MKYFFFLLLAIAFNVSFSNSASAQGLSKAERKAFTIKEDSIKKYAFDIVNGKDPVQRFHANDTFTRSFVRTLAMKNSFYYPFDSLQVISKLYPPDSSFRIFTWQLMKDDYMYLQKGAIQMRTADGSLKLFPLFDASMFTSKPEDSVRSRKNWIGAIYYRVIQKTFNGKNYYTLLGFDDYSVGSNRKWLEVLTFNETTGEPVFGGSFSFAKDDTTHKPTDKRFGIEYKKDAATTFNYDKEHEMIIFDHLISETTEPERKETYVPDGDFEGFKWKDGQWVHVDKIFDFKLKEGQEPVEDIIRDKNGNIDEQKLMERSKKNEEKAKKKKPGEN